MRDSDDADRVPEAEVDSVGIHSLVGLPTAERGPLLPVAEYLAAFREDYAQDRVTMVDKVECGQHFREPGFSSWDAFDRGAWADSLDLLAQERPKMSEQFTAAERRGLHLRRVRYVEIPPSDYVVWEMAVLRQRVDLGEQIRVVVGQGRPGIQAPPPRWFSELVILGTYSLFELKYKADGALAGAYRHTDPLLIEACRTDFETLYSSGEDLAAFHTRQTEPVLRARCAGDVR
ncbi:DUF6879 family protein [Streptomyces sp. NPDC048392]|uniref:DUF6879 family protein n=1 Tax=Streptomyces sp. NPDC048392 TaxID=3365543 RepID=UPI00372120B6